ncbi:hypothetical protein [Prescottella subtropica]|uniref:hypothetical protein n=1 Tax=Prescottella subtropica TaxID=2545757 RepID=UPI0010FA5C8D|nr:hypothetical protein [Prescottella subtropica]
MVVPERVHALRGFMPVRARQMSTRELLRATPARMLLIGIALLIATLVAGMVASNIANQRKQALDTLLSTTEPLARSAQNLYASLSLADAAAATAFLSDGTESGAARDRYAQALGTASAELVATSDELGGDDEGRRLLTSIATKLPTYTGLVETAHANSRVGNPVGGAYLAEASSLMQAEILPSAQALHAERAAEARAPQAGFGHPPWAAIGALVALIAALVATQVVLARRTRRTLNAGLLFTTVALSALLVWVLGAGIVSATAAHRAVRQGADPLATLSQARILGQQARAQENLQLVRREENAVHAARFRDDTDRLRGLLDDYPHTVGSDEAAAAAQALGTWVASHQRMTDALEVGDVAVATATMVGTGPDSSATHVDTVDGSLATAADRARGELRDDVGYASRVLSALGPGAVTITLIGAVGIPLGLWPRLREYQ